MNGEPLPALQFGDLDEEQQADVMRDTGWAVSPIPYTRFVYSVNRSGEVVDRRLIERDDY